MAAALALAGLLCSTALAADEEKKEGKAQATCPVTGKAIDKAFFAEQDGKRVYFCCGHCPAAFAKDPATYVKKLEDAGVVLEKVQTACPVTDGKIDKKFFTDYEGKRVYFCCGNCPAEFAKDPAKYLKKMTDAGVTPEPAPAPAPKAP
jgi:YHS domain-containing protein